MRVSIALLAAAACVTASAQQPTFDVASVKPNTSGASDSRVSMPPGRLTATNLPLRSLLEFAYGRLMLSAPPGSVPTGDIASVEGGPSWIDTDRFDVDAVVEGNPTRDQMLLMLRLLLADRFALVTHTEARPRPVFALVTAHSDGRAGPRLRVSDGTCRPRGGAPPADPSTPLCGVTFTADGMTGTGVTMTQLASTLSRFVVPELRRDVINKTGFTGTFDLTLQFSAASATGAQTGRLPAGGRGGAAPARSGAPAEPDPFAADIFVALHEQLGLKLEPQTVEGRVLVIDSAERPTAN